MTQNRTRKTTWKEFIKSHWSVLAACDFLSVELLIKGKLIRCLVFFAIELSTRKVEILGLHAQPNGSWMEQIARNASQKQLRYVLAEYLQYHHHEKIHQGLNHIIKPQHEEDHGKIICIERLSGLVKSYHRGAA